MNRMLSVVLGAAAVAALAACGASPGGGADDDGDGGGGTDAAAIVAANVYFPMTVGSTWVYETTYPADYAAYQGWDFTVMTTTWEVMSIEAIGEGARADFTVTPHFEGSTFYPDDPWGLPLAGWYEFSADGSLVRTAERIPEPNGIGLVDLALETSPYDVVATAGDGILTWPTPAEFDAGTVLTDGLEQTDGEAGSDGTLFVDTLANSFTPGGVEDVTVPAGDFSARRLTQQNDYTAEQDAGVDEYHVTQTLWLAEGTGLVKSTTSLALVLNFFTAETHAFGPIESVLVSHVSGS